MAATDPIISLSGLSTYNADIQTWTMARIDEAEGTNTTYTLTKNEDGNIVLSGSDHKTYVVTDSNTTYSFSQNGTLLTITGSDGSSKDINMSDETVDFYTEY